MSVLGLVRDTDVPVLPIKDYMKWKWDLIFSVLQVHTYHNSIQLQFLLYSVVLVCDPADLDTL